MRKLNCELGKEKRMEFFFFSYGNLFFKEQVLIKKPETSSSIIAAMFYFYPKLEAVERTRDKKENLYSYKPNGNSWSY